MTDPINIEPPPSIPGTAAPTKQIYPVRGVLWGIIFGIGLMVVAIVTKMISLSLGPALLVLVLGIALGTAWSIFGPAKPARA